VVRDSAENIIVNELVNYPEVDYDREADLLYKLARQAISKLGSSHNDEELRNIVLYHKREIGQYVYAQLQPHFYLEGAGYEEPVIRPFTRIEKHNYSKNTADSVRHYTETITPTHSIPSKIFGGYKKACHTLYKYDSKSEKDFSMILEQDKEVIKWLRPAQAQFAIYWKQNSQRYIPDFIVEDKGSIYMIEIKAENEINDEDVQEKAAAGRKYCEIVSEYNMKNNGKKWIYVLIPHTAVAPNMSFRHLANPFV
jgi:type III restriction enzyme